MKSRSEFKNRLFGQFKNLLVIQASVLLLCLAAASSPAQTYMVLHSFNGSDGANPRASLVLSNTTLFGTTLQGGISNEGTLFKVNTDGSDFTVLKNFTGGSDGAYPYGRLVLVGTTLYGTTQGGGLGSHEGGGTVFKVNVDGTGFTLIHAFTYDSDAFWPEAGLVLSGTTLYGTTEMSGVYYGTVFKVNIDGSGYKVLKSLGSSDGANPRAELVLSGTTLYGTTCNYGGNAGATVFKINVNGNNFTVLKVVNGNQLFSPVALSGTTLYGTGFDLNYYGTVFKINTDGSDYSVLKSFTNSWGSWAQPGLAGPVLSGATLYGTTSGSYGPPAFHTNSFGTVFQINTDGSGFSVLKSFGGGSDGATPTATLTWCGSTLYGTTCYGGISNCGVVFAIGYPPSIQTPPQTQTAELGSTVDFGLLITGSQPLVYQWFCDGTAIADCTNRVLCLSGIQASNVGTYSVVVTNLFGAVTSSPAMLNVIAPVERRPVPAINLNGDLGTTLHVEYADALGLPANWLPLDTVNLSNVAQFYFDITKPLPPQRFYRAWQTETPIVVPRLRLPYFVPAITITGSIGDTVRLDCINAIGPTDAWVTLDTITLTNTSQLYFDVSTAWNPGRLYRIVPLP